MYNMEVPSCFFFVLGSIFGSFLNVCIYRIPRKESVVFEPSHCPHCAMPVRPYDNIPVISYIMLLGKCRSCKCVIPFCYPAVELLTGVIIYLLYTRFSLGLDFFVFSFLSMTLIVLSVIDIRHHILFDKIIVPTVVVGFVFSFFRESFSPTQAFYGFLLGGGVFYIIAVMSPNGMGGGDIKLMALCGAFTGWVNVILIMLIASLSGATVGGAALIATGSGRKTRIPFGPFISFGSIVSILYGKDIVRWYMQTFFLL